MQKMFRSIAVLACIALLFTALPLFTSAEDLTYGDFSYTVSEDGTAVTITSYNGTDAAVAIPAKIDELPVTAVGMSAFAGNETMTSVTIPTSVKLIDINAFNSCIGLTTVSIPQTVETVGSMAFYNCFNLAEIKISPRTYDIGSQAFHNTKWFSNAPAGPLYAGRVLYCYIGSMPKGTTITVEYGTAAIAPYAFAQQPNLAGINFPVGMRVIGSCAFLNCTGLLSVRIPPSVTDIQSGAFLGAAATTVYGVTDSAAHTMATEENLFFKHDAALDFLAGDVNEDGRVNSSDFRLLLRHLIDPAITLDPDRLASCDALYDGKVDTSDVRMFMILSIRG